MDGIQLRDEAVRDRVRLAEEFLDPSEYFTFDASHTDKLILVGDQRARRQALPRSLRVARLT